MPNRPYLTSAEAATYCGFKTIGGIQQAVRRGKLKPAGRRGGTGTYVFATEDLDRFLTGGLTSNERLFVAPPELPHREAPRKSPREAPQQRAPGPAPKPRTKGPKSAARQPVTGDDPVARISRALASPGPDSGRKTKR